MLVLKNLLCVKELVNLLRKQEVRSRKLVPQGADEPLYTLTGLYKLIISQMDLCNIVNNLLDYFFAALLVFPSFSFINSAPL